MEQTLSRWLLEIALTHDTNRHDTILGPKTLTVCEGMSSVAYRSPKKSGSVGFTTGFDEFVIDFAWSDFASFPDSDESWTSDFCNEFCSSSFSADSWSSKELLSFLSEKNLQARKEK